MRSVGLSSRYRPVTPMPAFGASIRNVPSTRRSASAMVPNLSCGQNQAHSAAGSVSARHAAAGLAGRVRCRCTSVVIDNPSGVAPEVASGHASGVTDPIVRRGGFA
jgi:hypothetical protein